MIKVDDKLIGKEVITLKKINSICVLHGHYDEQGKYERFQIVEVDPKRKYNLKVRQPLHLGGFYYWVRSEDVIYYNKKVQFMIDATRVLKRNSNEVNLEVGEKFMDMINIYKNNEKVKFVR